MTTSNCKDSRQPPTYLEEMLLDHLCQHALVADRDSAKPPTALQGHRGSAEDGDALADPQTVLLSSRQQHQDFIPYIGSHMHLWLYHRQKALEKGKKVIENQKYLIV